MSTEKKYLEDFYYQPLTGEQIARYKEEAKRLSDDDLWKVQEIFKEERFSQQRSDRLHSRLVNEEINKLINMASTFDEFCLLWKAGRYPTEFNKDELLGFWQEFLDGKGGDNPDGEVTD